MTFDTGSTNSNAWDEENLFSEIHLSFSEELLSLYNDMLDAESASDLSSKCIAEFRAQLHIHRLSHRHLQHRRGEAISLEEPTSALFQIARRILGNALDPAESTSNESSILAALFGMEVSFADYRSLLGELRDDGRYMEFQIITEFVDQYEASASTPEDRVMPSYESVARELSSTFSPDHVCAALQDFETRLRELVDWR